MCTDFVNDAAALLAVLSREFQQKEQLQIAIFYVQIF